MKYNLENLLCYSKENNIYLIGNYENVNRETKISGKCLSLECEDNFCKTFRLLVEKTGPYCHFCSLKKGKIESNKKYIEKNVKNKWKNKLYQIVNDQKIILTKNYDEEVINMYTKIEGKCLNFIYCKSVFLKQFRHFLDKGGAFCEECSKINAKTKRIDTCIKKYGVEHHYKLDNYRNENKKYNLELLKSLIEKYNLTLLKKYSETELHAHCKIRAKCYTIDCNKNFCKNFIDLTILGPYCNKCKKNNSKIIHYDYELLSSLNLNLLKDYSECNLTGKTRIEGKCFNIKCDKIFNKSFETILKSGSYCNKCSVKKGIEKKEETNLKKFGAPYPSQNPIIAEKFSKNSYKLKEYVFPSGKKIYIQGYEDKALDHLLKNDNIDENDIIVNKKEVPEIWYIDKNNKKHRYYVDIYIKSLNKCIEVKSTWTFLKKIQIVFLKQDSVKFNGHQHEIWVYNNKNIISKY